MSDSNMNATTVVIIGAGVAGLTLGTFRLHQGIDCIILEKHGRDYVEQRQRAGVIATRAARMSHAGDSRTVSSAEPPPSRCSISDR
jgi:p-hydroxybenzoate 3-monooxygenase